MHISKTDIIKMMIENNKQYAKNGIYTGNVGSNAKNAAISAQHPYAAVLTCSDSRVIPEVIFGAGIGELFVVRTAGNVADSVESGSLEYAVDHLKIKNIIVLGHTNCGAVGAALHGEFGGKTGYITRMIKAAIGEETDYYKACVMNVCATVKKLNNEFGNCECNIYGAIYDLKTGEVTFL